MYKFIRCLYCFNQLYVNIYNDNSAGKSLILEAFGYMKKIISIYK